MIELENINHSFEIGTKKHKRKVPVLHDIHLKVEQGEILSIMGRSGTGKSTLLHLISGYIKPQQGKIMINDTEVTHFTEGEWADFRLQHLGFVFQNFQLIPSMTAMQNAELPLILHGVPEAERKNKVTDMMKRLDIEKYMEHYPSELSGGQQQRVSIARALMLNPSIILADEPTGSLDSENEQSLLHFIKQLNEEHGITFLIITHDEQVAKVGHRTLLMKDGRIAEGGHAI
ncbi:ABC transporter ATP-binding protein [Longirhabdus pacifica]|uniref:ABC transporter ATP-binding protein n=1 Tax=Longirhabdus pacifica TaxID=2305227 RepID=UPI00100925E9|nr:ABC transporter ATP-binding protein [Longirhabdus pacifica]